MAVKSDFDKIMDFAPDNRSAFSELKEAVKKKTVIPFVGAGLSADVYPQWKDVLKELSKKLTDNRDEVKDLIKRKEYEKAAERIANSRPPMFLYNDMLEIFNENKLRGANLNETAAYTLPFIFPEKPVITTNYDRLLEQVYSENGRPFENKYTHNSHAALAAAQKSLHFLFKIHGDIGSEYVHEDDIVFTAESYDRHYAQDGNLVKTLKIYFENSQMLFLGCSLEYDRTFTTFKDVCGGTELQHFAILPCKKKDIVSKLNLFGKERIFPIFFNPKSPIGFKAVRIILDNLLRELDPDAHSDYVARLPKQPRKNANSFLYSTRASKFFGREQEMEELISFAGNDAHFMWWAILGPGGMGKSRLSLEFEDKLKKAGWSVLRLQPNHYHSSAGVKSFTDRHENVLLIADYGQGYIKELGDLMRDYVDKNHGKLRLLILERDNSAVSKPLADQLIESGEGIRESLYNGKPMQLLKVSDDALGGIIRSYAEYMGKTLSYAQVNLIIHTLSDVDKDLVRPLYALFITDAVCEGSDPRQWKRNEVLDWVLIREERLIARNIGEHIGTEPADEQKDAVRKLRAIATFCGDIDTDTLKSSYSGAWGGYADSFDKQSTSPTLIKTLVKAGLIEENRLLAIRPDLLGEYFVMKELESIADELFCKGWADDRNKLEFLFRLILDYKEDLKDKTAFFDKIFTGNPVESINAFDYSGILVNITGLFPDFSKDAAETLRRLSEKRFPDDREIALPYAMGLVNLSNKQNDPTEGAKTIETLRMLSEERFPDDREIALRYAMGLFNLSNEQNDPTERAKTIETLRKLSEERFPDDREIALEYATGLFSLSCGQNDPTEGAKTIETLRMLSEERFPDDREIALNYAKGLFNLFCVQNDPTEGAKTIETLRKLSEERFPNDREIALNYAMGLFNLSCDQNDPTERTKSIDTLRKLSEERFPDDREIALRYARGLVNLSNKQNDPTEGAKTIETLRMLSEERFPNDREIALEYAKGLFNLFCDQNDPTERAKSIEILRMLSEERFPNDREIALNYAEGLVNLSNKQNDPTERAKSIETLRKLSEERFPDDREIALRYAKGLFNLSCDQNDPTERAKTIETLRKLSEERFPDDREIALRYAMGLFILSNKQNDPTERAKTIETLRKLSEERFPDDREIALNYAMGLFILSNKQNDPTERAKTIETLRKLSEERFPDDREIALIYAMGLVLQGIFVPETASANEDKLLSMPNDVIARTREFFDERLPEAIKQILRRIYPRLFR